jgi:sensor histidine kinase YesM
MLDAIAKTLDAELIVRFKVKTNGNSIQAETLGQLQSQGNERDKESGPIDRSAAACA